MRLAKKKKNCQRRMHNRSHAQSGEKMKSRPALILQQCKLILSKIKLQKGAPSDYLHANVILHTEWYTM